MHALFAPLRSWIGYAVRNNETGFNVFRLDGEWKFHLEWNSENGFNLWSLENEWIGFAI
jgi:hypothetical protein